jgi:glycosyltransferase involved in cell wall biosynthesis
MSNNQPLVCICIPNFNNKDTISQTLDSLLSQTYKNIIIKIFDNMSDDGSWEIVKEYSKKYPNIQALQNSKNIGAEANFTKCIQGLEGEYGALYHADDLYSPLMVEIQVKYLSEKDVSAVFVKADYINDKSEKIGEQSLPDKIQKNDFYQLSFKKLFGSILEGTHLLFTPSAMARVDIYQEQIKFWDGCVFKTAADIDVWLRFSLVKDVGLITKKLMSYRLSEASYTYRTQFIRMESSDLLKVVDYYLDNYAHLGFSLVDCKYLKFKDNVIIFGNKLLNNDKPNCKEIKVSDFFTIGNIFFSKKKTAIFFYAILLKTLTCLNLNFIALRVVKLAYKYKI